MYISNKAKELMIMELKARVFNSIDNILSEKGYESQIDALSDIISVVDDALFEISEIESEILENNNKES